MFAPVYAAMASQRTKRTRPRVARFWFRACILLALAARRACAGVPSAMHTLQTGPATATATANTTTLECACVVVQTASRSNDPLEFQGSTRSYVFSTVPKSLEELYDVFPRPVESSFACSCHRNTDDALAAFIVAAVETRPNAASAAECLATGVLERACDLLSNLKLTNCKAMWSTGFSADAHRSAFESGAILEATRRLFRTTPAPAGCLESVDFITTLDSQIGLLGRPVR